MWKGADPDVELFICRHPESKANKEDANYGRMTPLSEQGLEQIPHIVNFVRDLRIDCMISSDADRAMLPMMSMLDLKIPSKGIYELYGEFRRPQWTIGKSNSDPEVQAALKRRIDEFGPAYEPQDGEERFEETWDIVERGLEYILVLARETGYRRFLMFTHGLRGRHYYSKALAGENKEFFAQLFKATYATGGYDNNAIMYLWHGFPFRGTERCWNVELGFSFHIPEEIRR